jgi:y4mF family transcriptional regulator
MCAYVHVESFGWDGMRIGSALDLGRYVKARRRELGKTQVTLATEAGVSRRWLSDLEAGKATAEIGLVLRTLDALRLDLLAEPIEYGPDHVDLNEVLGNLRKPT